MVPEKCQSIMAGKAWPEEEMAGKEGVARGTGGREGVARGTGENLPRRIRRKGWCSLQRPDLRGLLASV